MFKEYIEDQAGCPNKNYYLVNTIKVIKSIDNIKCTDYSLLQFKCKINLTFHHDSKPRIIHFKSFTYKCTGDGAVNSNS